jgi:hypothetical protein
MTRSQQEQEQPMPGQAPEARYAYYRRCQQFRKNGRQCKAPALKGEDLCYMHQAQARAARRREEFRRSLGLPRVWKPGPAMQRAIREVMQALIDGRIDESTAGPLLVEMREAVASGSAE